MKKLFVLTSLLLVATILSNCDDPTFKKGNSKRQKCSQLYEKAMSCVREAGGTPDKAMSDKEKFLTDCKKNYKEAQEIMKMDCKDLAMVFGSTP